MFSVIDSIGRQIRDRLLRAGWLAVDNLWKNLFTIILVLEIWVREPPIDGVEVCVCRRLGR